MGCPPPTLLKQRAGVFGLIAPDQGIPALFQTMPIMLPLICPRCSLRIDIRSDEPIPVCVSCHGKLKPAGPVRAMTDEERGREVLERSLEPLDPST